jgi:hypothetical protein
MNKYRKAIKAKCLDCAADESLEVKFCVVFDCPLWPYRTGVNVETKAYKRAMELAWGCHPQIVREIERGRIDKAHFFPATIAPGASLQIFGGKKGGSRRAGRFPLKSESRSAL